MGYLADILAVLAKITQVPKAMKVNVENPVLTVKLEEAKALPVLVKEPVELKRGTLKEPMVVKLSDFAGNARLMVKNYEKPGSKPSWRTTITEVDYWKSVYGLGSSDGSTLRQALPVVIVDSARAASSYTNSVAVRSFYSEQTGGDHSRDSQDDSE